MVTDNTISKADLHTTAKTLNTMLSAFDESIDHDHDDDYKAILKVYRLTCMLIVLQVDVTI
jgi:hypothetical protein